MTLLALPNINPLKIKDSTKRKAARRTSIKPLPVINKNNNRLNGYLNNATDSDGDLLDQKETVSEKTEVEQKKGSLRNIPQGIPQNLFDPMLLNKSNDGEVNVIFNLSLIKALQMKVNLSRAAVRWKLAMKLVQMRKHLEDVQSKEEKPLITYLRNAQMTKEFFPDIAIPQFVMLKAKYDLLAMAVIKQILDLPLELRSKRYQESLDEILKKFTSIGKYRKDLRFQLYDVCKLEKFQKGTLIIAPTNTATSFYLILSGVCKICTIPRGRKLQALYPPQYQNYQSNLDVEALEKNQHKNTPITVSFLCAGDTIGEFQTIKELERRSPRIKIETLTETEVLRIDKDDLEKQQWLHTVSSFRSLPRYTLDLIAKTSKLQKYSPKSCIIRAQDASTYKNIFFMVSGEATAYKLTTFIKQPSIRSTIFKPKFTLVPYNADQMVSPATGEDIVFELVPIGQIPLKAVFPHGLELRGETKDSKDKERRKRIISETFVSNGFDKHTVIVGSSYIGNGYNPGSFDYDGGNGNSGTCECLVISEIELRTIVGNDAKLESILIDLPCMPDVNEKEIQQSYLSSRGWHLM
ncbi:hypothetical protein HK099_004831 [Clydaea vesicula]|uniref:Cyclic nucleotide-binding domain-containing protein n=1 Tax=Clydaea vesicula TaxID=447962 RepID=A0AAD5TZY5_9FUNG|nr:hypothetical protein HK099_004831 [Clydaea vesicula]